MKKVIGLIFVTLLVFTVSNVQAQENPQRSVEPKDWRVDPYLGFFATFSPQNSHNIAGGELRLSVPFVEIDQHLAITTSVELGFIGSNDYSAWRASVVDAPLMARAAVTVGARIRIDAFSMGLRTGFNPWFTGPVSYPGSTNTHITARPGWLIGTEIGFGAPELTLTASFDLHLGENGTLLPLVGFGVCL